MPLQIEGTLYEVFDGMQVTERFKKREFVIEIEAGNGYKEYPKFQLTQERCLLLDNYKKGDKVTIFFDLAGRPYNKPDGTTLYFTNLNVWKMEGTQETPMEDVPPHQEADIPPEQPADGSQAELDDLPF